MRLSTAGMFGRLFSYPEVSRGPGCRRHRNRPKASAGLVFASILALGVPTFIAESASAATRTASVQVPHSSAYCQLVSGVQNAEGSAFGSLTTPNEAAAAMKSAYQKFKADESKVMSVVPPQLKGAYQTLFSAMNTIFSDLATVGYNITKLPASTEKSLAADSSSLASASSKIAAYAKQVCHLTVGGGTGLGTSNYGSGGPTSGMGGTITKINTGAHSFTLKTDVSPSVGETGKSYTILTSSSTKFVSTAGKAETFNALKVGEHVGVVGSTTNGGFLATNLSIRLSGSNTKAGGTTTSSVSGNTTVGGSNGSVTVGAKLPAGFPKAVPLPANSTLLEGISESAKFYELWLAVNGTQASVFGAYKSALGQAGFTITSSGGVAGTMMAIVSSSSSWSAQASIFPEGEVSGVPKSDLKAGQVLVALVVT